MRNLTLSMILAFATSLIGLIVMFGWFLDIAILKSILPSWVTMKFTTALSFLLSGLILYAIEQTRSKSSTLSIILLPVCSMAMALLMGTLLVSSLIGVKSGVEDLFITEAVGAINSTVPGRPSFGTMVSFLLIVFVGLFQLFAPKHCNLNVLSLAGWSITALGGSAIIGYLINQPVLYYTIEGFSTAMAFHTAILFCFVGVGLGKLNK